MACSGGVCSRNTKSASSGGYGRPIINAGKSVGRGIKSGARTLGRAVVPAAIGYGVGGPVGAGIGAASSLMAPKVGTGVDAIRDAFGGTNSSQTPGPEVPRFSPEVQQAIEQQFMQANQATGTEGFNPIEDRARRQFTESTIPSIAERFTSMGGDTRGSSAFEGVLGRSASDLESQLAALRSQYGQQQQAFDLQKLLGTGSMLEKNYQTKQPTFAQSLAPSAIQGGTDLLKTLLMMKMAPGFGGSTNPLGVNLGGWGQ